MQNRSRTLPLQLLDWIGGPSVYFFAKNDQVVVNNYTVETFHNAIYELQFSFYARIDHAVLSSQIIR